jgi:hypothetical protein
VKSQNPQDLSKDHLEMYFDLTQFSDLSTVVATLAKTVTSGGVTALQIGNLDRAGVLGDPQPRAIYVSAPKAPATEVPGNKKPREKEQQPPADLLVNVDVCGQDEKPVIVRVVIGQPVIYVEPMP